MSSRLYQPPKFAHKFVKQARLPQAAYSGLTPGLDHYAKEDQEKTWCPCHVTTMYDATRFKGCFHCYKKDYKCCEERLLNETVEAISTVEGGE